MESCKIRHIRLYIRRVGIEPHAWRLGFKREMDQKLAVEQTLLFMVYLVITKTC